MQKIKNDLPIHLKTDKLYLEFFNPNTGDIFYDSFDMKTIEFNMYDILANSCEDALNLFKFQGLTMSEAIMFFALYKKYDLEFRRLPLNISSSPVEKYNLAMYKNNGYDVSHFNGNGVPDILAIKRSFERTEIKIDFYFFEFKHLGDRLMPNQIKWFNEHKTSNSFVVRICYNEFLDIQNSKVFSEKFKIKNKKIGDLL